jgi:hypothetical protein
MNKKAKIEIELFIVLIAVALIVGGLLLLIQSGIISVKADSSEILNTEFIPMGRQGSLLIQNFYFCDNVNEDYLCLGEKREFELGSEVHFLFMVQSSTFNGDIKLVENYRIRNPNGDIILDVDQKNNLHFDISSKERVEMVTFKDYFKLGYDLPLGEYTLELVIENPLLDKKVVRSEKFRVVSAIDEDFGPEDE